MSRAKTETKTSILRRTSAVSNLDMWCYLIMQQQVMACCLLCRFFLAWLLNPNESHNLRDTFLKHFLLDISVEFDTLNFQDFEIRREWKNIDLLIITNGFAVCIENKVDSQEHSNQLVRYKEIIKES